jgi:hypothetical protein
MRTRFFAVGFLFVTSLGACALPAYNPLPAYDRSVISQEEIAGTHAVSALDLVQKLRPSFLSSRGALTMIGRQAQLPTVYVNGFRYGSAATLQDIPVAQIAEIRMYRVGSASVFGPGETAGVLAVTLRTR